MHGQAACGGVWHVIKQSHTPPPTTLGPRRKSTQSVYGVRRLARHQTCAHPTHTPWHRGGPHTQSVYGVLKDHTVTTTHACMARPRATSGMHSKSRTPHNPEPRNARSLCTACSRRPSTARRSTFPTGTSRSRRCSCRGSARSAPTSRSSTRATTTSSRARARPEKFERGQGRWWWCHQFLNFSGAA